jgi:D-alanyl-D-alanine carboxypeptidase/D-alanyl-D-alanine-endopeptidase (penicillin-binding protein 4)
VRLTAGGGRFAIFAVMLLAAALPALARDLPAPVETALAKAGVPTSAVAVVVEPVDGGAPIVSHRASAAMNPASVMKVVTSHAAFDLLGPAFTFKTDFLVRGELSNGVLQGDLAIRGGGDPKLTYERLWQVAHELRARGLREIRGDVIIDRSYFTPVPHDPARFDNDPRRAYNVGSDAFLVNFQAVNFKFVPLDGAVRVVPEPDLPNVEIATQIKLTKEPCGAWRRQITHDIVENGLVATVVFGGSFSQDCGEKTWPLSLFDGPRFSESVLRWVWSEAGGVLRGKVRAGTVPTDAKLFYRNESEPLASIVRDMNKYSNNVMARQVFLALSAEKGSGPGEAQASERIVREWLKAKGIDASEIVVENGSGLSRDARASAGTIASVLRSAWASATMPELMASFPVLSVDGTLKKRGLAPVAGRAHLKGGTLTGVQSEAGYVLDNDNKRWVVVMIMNHPNANAAQPALDALTAWIAKGKGR